MLRKLLMYSTFFFSLLSVSQEFSISGNVNDENNKALPYANVILVDIDSSAPVKGTMTDNFGYFIINNLIPKDYILEIRFLGYKVYTTRVELDRDINFEAIILQENQEVLNDVTVIAKRPTVSRSVDRLVFNVENSTLSNTNALDVLKHTPGVMVFDGQITVKNNTPVVYINDRKVHLSPSEVQQLLEGTTATNIKSVEVITNPPAKYDAEGAAVINILTSKNIIAGYHGNVFGAYKQGFKFPKYSLGTSHFFKTKKLDAYFNYSINPRKDFRHNNEYVNFIQNNEVTTSWDTDFERRRESKNQNINANIDYEIDNRNIVSFTTNILLSPRKYSKIFVNSLTEVYDANRELDSTFYTNNRLVNVTHNLAFTLNYKHDFIKEGESLTLNAHYTNYDFSSFQKVNTDYRFPDNALIRTNRFQTFSGQVTELFTSQLDYVLPCNNTSLFELGFKTARIESESILTQYNFVDDIRIEDLQNSDTFLYEETNYAAYSSFSKDWKHWNIKSGLRVEYTDIKGNSLITNQVNNNNYLKFFPSVHILKRFKDKHDVYFNYNRRIHRPRYNQLNPFKYFLSDNAYITGNPDLKPQIDDVFTLGCTINEVYTFELYYRYENDPIQAIVFMDNMNNIQKNINTNIDSSVSYGIDFSTYKKIVNRWNLYALSSLFYYENKFLALESSNELVNNDKWSLYMQLVNYFSLLKDKSLNVDVSYLFISGIASGASIVSDRSGLTIDLRKTLWSDRASLSIGVADIFNGLNFNQQTKYLNQDILLDSNLENRMFTLGFNYKFGNYNLKTNNKNIELIERDRLSNN